MKYVFLLVISLALLSPGCKKKKEIIAEKNTGTPKDFLSDENYHRLLVQVVYTEGMSPSASSISSLVSFLNGLLNKSSGIEVIQRTVASPGKAVLGLADLIELEKMNRTVITADETITAYIFFADADYKENSGNAKVLGIAYGGSSMVLFEKTVRDLSGGIGQPSVASVETSVLEHEFGHVLGLVNNGTAQTSAHQDEPHGKHCNNTSCLMYYATETSDIVKNLLGNNIPKLDENCRKDLQASGGKWGEIQTLRGFIYI